MIFTGLHNVVASSRFPKWEGLLVLETAGVLGHREGPKTALRSGAA